MLRSKIRHALITTTTAFRKDADKFRRAAFPAGLAQVVIEDDFSVVL